MLYSVSTALYHIWHPSLTRKQNTPHHVDIYTCTHPHTSTTMHNIFPYPYMYSPTPWTYVQGVYQLMLNNCGYCIHTCMIHILNLWFLVILASCDNATCDLLPFLQVCVVVGASWTELPAGQACIGCFCFAASTGFPRVLHQVFSVSLRGSLSGALFKHKN